MLAELPSSPEAAPTSAWRAATELAACGATVVIAGRQSRSARRGLPADRPVGELVAGDIRREEDASRIVRECLSRHGRLDILVNNAGGQYFVPAEAIEPKGWRAVTGLNVGGTERMTRLAAELAMRPAGGGTIINITLSPHHGLTGMTHSSAARAAIEGYTRALAREWAADGIAVLALAAGHFDTASLRKYPDVVWKGAARSVPLQRLGREQEHAWLVALAASPLGPRAVRLRDHARRRPGQLVRPVAAAVARGGRGRGADGGAPIKRLSGAPMIGAHAGVV